jgi:hypothetical protein
MVSYRLAALKPLLKSHPSFLKKIFFALLLVFVAFYALFNLQGAIPLRRGLLSYHVSSLSVKAFLPLPRGRPVNIPSLHPLVNPVFDFFRNFSAASEKALKYPQSEAHQRLGYGDRLSFIVRV